MTSIAGFVFGRSRPFQRYAAIVEIFRNAPVSATEAARYVTPASQARGVEGGAVTAFRNLRARLHSSAAP